MEARSSLDERFAPALAQLEGSKHPDAASMKQQLQEVMSAAPSSTMAKWCQGHHGQQVHTIQINNHHGEIWAPLGRLLDAQSYATKALFDGSARDYAGMRVLAANDEALIVADDWHTVAYLLAG